MTEVKQSPRDYEALGLEAYREEVARIIDPEAMETTAERAARYKREHPWWTDDFADGVAESVEKRPLKSRDKALAKADAILALPVFAAPLAERRELREVAKAARLLITEGLRLTVAGLIVREKSDKSDPHYRLCTALEDAGLIPRSGRPRSQGEG